MSRPSRPLPGLTGPGRRARWRRRVLRRVLSAVLAATAVLLVVLELRPPPNRWPRCSSRRARCPPAPCCPTPTCGSTTCRAARCNPERWPRPSGCRRPPGRRRACERRGPHGIPAGPPRGARRPARREGRPARRVGRPRCRRPARARAVRARLPCGRWPGPGGGRHRPRGRPGERAGAGALTDAPPRGVVLSLSAAEADAVLSGPRFARRPGHRHRRGLRRVTGRSGGGRGRRSTTSQRVSGRASRVRPAGHRALGCWRGSASPPLVIDPTEQEPP